MQEFIDDFCKTLARMIKIEEEAEKRKTSNPTKVKEEEDERQN